jgi:hypothetical protein
VVSANQELRDAVVGGGEGLVGDGDGVLVAVEVETAAYQ